MIPRERMQRYQLSNPGDAQLVVQMLPIESITYRLFRVAFNVTIGTGPLQPWLQLFDGGGEMTFSTGCPPAGSAGKNLIAVFAVNLPRAGPQDTYNPSTQQFTQTGLPPDLYVTPGDILRFGLNGATAPGSGGDNWVSTMVDIVVPA